MTQSEAGYPYEPDYCDPPGDTLNEFISTSGMSQAEIARRTDFSIKHINQVCQGLAPISADAAIRLARVTGISANTWLSLEAGYRIFASIRDEDNELAEQVGWLDYFPLQELKRRGWIQPQLEGTSLLRAMLHFFQVASPAAWGRVWATPTAYRVDRKREPNYGALSSWIRIGELRASRHDLPHYDRETLKESIPELRALTRVESPIEWAPRLQEIFGRAGVHFIIEKEISGARVSGVVRWLQDGNPMIQLSLRYSWADIFWFTLFHEIGHLLLHDSKRLTLVDDMESSQRDGVLESEADGFASRTLIPSSREPELTQLATYGDVIEFSRRIEIHPGIVVGRLKHDGQVRWDQFNGMRVRFKWAS